MTHYIGGHWLEGAGASLVSHNPATGEELWHGSEASPQQVSDAVDAARDAFRAWSALSFEERLFHVKAYRTVLEKRKEELATSISKEMGKPLWEARTEVAAMIGKIDLSADASQQRTGKRIIKEEGPRLLTRHRPHGVVAIFGPFNFPGHLPNGHIVPALLAGNTVVFKPSEQTPSVGEIMVQCWEEAQLPQGVVNLVQGAVETGKALANHNGIDGLFFTGSANTGRILSELFSKKPGKILALELGGNNPLVVWDVADLQSAAYHSIQSAYLTAGQRCTCARRLIIPEGKGGDTFLEALQGMIAKIRVGAHDETPEPFMGPVVSPEAADKVLAAQEQLLSKGGTALIRCERIRDGGAFLSPGLIDVTDVEGRSDEEIFGPLLQVIRVRDFDAALQEANNTSYGLSAGLLDDSAENYERFRNEVRAGIINWNNQTTGASGAAPFGGCGASGNFRPSAYYAADYCAYPVASMESPTVQMPAKPVPGIE